MARTHVGLSNESIWTATSERPSSPDLVEDLVTDVCVIGAGVTGLSTAYELTRVGKKVVVLDTYCIGGGMTSMTTAHLTSAVDDRYFELERLHGREITRLVAEGHTNAIDRIEDVVGREQIDCSFARVDGYLTLGAGADASTLECELEAARNAGLQQVDLVTEVCYPGRGTEPCLRFRRQGRFHPLPYLHGLASAITRAGGKIFGNTHVDDVKGGSVVEVLAGDHVVRAGAAVVATNSPITERVAIHTKQAPYMTYVIAARIPENSVLDCLRWDTENPYHYVRLHRVASNGDHTGGDYVIVGGEDHKTGQESDAQRRFERLTAWARERFPAMGVVEYSWAGEIMESVDRLAFIGPSPSEDEGVYIITGESGVGITHATLAGAIVRDAILGRDNAWAALYDPSRRTYGAASTYVKENANVAAQYVDWVTGGDIASADDIAPGNGAILRRGFLKVAAYRDEQGVLYERSAVCPHLGCIVRWNAAELTWDCPCHGSRFDKHGYVVSGPAKSDLRPLSED